MRGLLSTRLPLMREPCKYCRTDAIWRCPLPDIKLRGALFCIRPLFFMLCGVHAYDLPVLYPDVRIVLGFHLAQLRVAFSVISEPVFIVVHNKKSFLCIFT